MSRTSSASPERGVTVIPNGIDPRDLGQPPETSTALRLRFAAPDERLVLLVGRLVYEKGFHVALDALPRPDRAARQAALRRRRHGHGRGRAEAPGAPSSACSSTAPSSAGSATTCSTRSTGSSDLCIVPSIYEPFGLVALEAMASGCLCVVADTGGLREVVPDDGSVGLRFRSRDAPRSAAMVERVLTDDAARARCRRGARARAALRLGRGRAADRRGLRRARGRDRAGRMTPRIRCRAVFLDAGGVIVLPDRRLVAGALSAAWFQIDPSGGPARPLPRAPRLRSRRRLQPHLPAAFCAELGIAAARTNDALNALAELEDRSRSGEILWSEPTPGAFGTIAALRRRGLAVVIVTNSDGHAEENLRDCGIVDVPVIDSTVVGYEKPDVRIFEAALARTRAGIRTTDVVHVGDTLAADIAGARAAGITPIHFDPFRACRARDHRHIRTLAGIWRHVAPARLRQT